MNKKLIFTILILFFLRQICLSQSINVHVLDKKLNEDKYDYKLNSSDNFIVKAYFDTIVFTDKCPCQEKENKCYLYKIKIDTVYFMQCDTGYKINDLYNIRFVVVRDTSIKYIQLKTQLNISLSISAEPKNYLFFVRTIPENLKDIKKFIKANLIWYSITHCYKMNLWQRTISFLHIKKSEFKNSEKRKIKNTFSEYIKENITSNQ